LPRRRRDPQSPEALCRAQAERAVDHSILIPDEALLSLKVPDPLRRRTLQQAVNHYHADRWRHHRPWLSPAAGIPLVTLAEARSQLDFAVLRLGYKVVVVAGDLPLQDFGPLWARAADLRVPVLVEGAVPGTATINAVFLDGPPLDDPHRFYTGANPDFFRATTVADRPSLRRAAA
jgi:hypothetical protein